MEMKRFRLPALSAATLFAAVVVSPLQAATVTFNYDQSFGAVSPVGPAPYATAVFDDGSGSVKLTIDVAGTVGEADLTQAYFNFDPALDLNSLSFAYDSGASTGPEAAGGGNNGIFVGTDAFMAGGDGSYDILFDFPPPPGSPGATFEAGETVVYTITSSEAITASSFNLFGTPGPGQGNAGPFLSVARIQSTGIDGKGSDWVGVVPVPAAVWLFASGLLGLVGIARRRRS